jgi:carbonic anhydrase/acetyltransferase-like protein (isoleucine patch superfamily)
VALWEFEGRRPTLGPGTFVPETADVVGDVRLGSGCFVGMGARLRGDYGTITIGDETSVQENVVVHARAGEACTVGNRVQLGHGCALHNCTVEDSAVIGVGAVVSDYAVVGRWAIVAEGAVVRSGQKVEPKTVVAGVPAKPLGPVTEEHRKLWDFYKDTYADLARRRYPAGLKRIG